MLEKLCEISLFQELTEDQLQGLSKGTEVWLEPGQTLFQQGDPPEYFYVLLEGEIQILLDLSNQQIVLDRFKTGMFFGELPILAGMHHLGSGQAVHRSHLYCIPEDVFWQMLMAHPCVRKNVLGCMAIRVQEFRMLSQQHEKLIALGTLAAGLAHELNNPASAAHRAALQLRDTMQVLQSLALRCIDQRLAPTQLEYLLQLKSNAIEYAATPFSSDPLAQMDDEDELAGWLDEHGVNDGWKFAAVLVGAGIKTEQLQAIGDQIASHTLTDMLSWLEATLTVSSVLNVLEQAIERVYDLVKAVKAYSYMDQSALQNVDLHQGLENTLTILSHKLKKHRVKVIREYYPELPTIQANGSALNQVWTNLIDNAIDALSEGGTIWVRTLLEKDSVLVEIADNGSGIPPEIQGRIFEPFFTTKKVGVGTGLGLEISYRIVVGQHNGDIRCFSEPGNTSLHVRLPIAGIKFT
ncbi:MULTISPECIES: ATP-binding protein [unclassified Nostoc]|uniref:ATP-binding protein n=1 Tax=unclassified Nostoc TaxID=2593658 RepID=UPI002AD48525|nr:MULTISPECIES: ATP-binding protein [unclassified Nostoc]MDZ8126306.1 ATP-binding protein [Nostoc sp. CmiVER01]MDZ8225128.1 ATP-binding protein [Nostoc sp. ChiVER01]